MADEVVNYDLKQFKRMDANHDGKLSLDEYAAGIPHYQTMSAEAYHARLAAMDADGDCYVTPDELAAYERAVLKQADQDGDGRVAMDEWLTATVGKTEWFPASP
jgi:Ca2+-binding EF-hand superfamily protein